MSSEVGAVSASTPALEGVDNRDIRFSRSWYGFFAFVSRKIRILDGNSTTSATTGTADALPALPAGYMTINDMEGVPRKVPYYNP